MSGDRGPRQNAKSPRRAEAFVSTPSLKENQVATDAVDLRSRRQEYSAKEFMVLPILDDKAQAESYQRDAG